MSVLLLRSQLDYLYEVSAYLLRLRQSVSVIPAEELTYLKRQNCLNEHPHVKSYELFDDDLSLPPGNVVQFSCICMWCEKGPGSPGYSPSSVAPLKGARVRCGLRHRASPARPTGSTKKNKLARTGEPQPAFLDWVDGTAPRASRLDSVRSAASFSRSRASSVTTCLRSARSLSHAVFTIECC